MGVALEAIAEIFGYRLKKIDNPVPYTSSYAASPQVEDEVNLCFLTDIFLFPAIISLAVFYASFSLIR
jgi:hypothetical protein